MSASVIGGIMFVCAFGCALLGMFLGAALPPHHLGNDSKDVIKLATAMIVTLSALVLGFLIASSKNSFDIKDREMREGAAHALLLDRTLAQYGTEASDIRDLLRQTMARRISQIWPEESARLAPQAISQGSGIEPIQRRLLDLSPRDDAQRWLKARALQASGEIGEARWLFSTQAESSFQWPFLAMLMFWIAIIFGTFGLFSPRNGTVTATLFVCSLSIAGAIYLIVQMDQPYRGLIKISSVPMLTALDRLGQ